MANVCFGSMTIVDLTDLGEFSVYPMSNLPLTIANNPNTNVYTPNWADNNLTISPVCYYAGQPVTPSSVTWTVQKNAGSATDISSSNGESVNGVNLVVTKNRFSEDSSIDMLTYYVTAKYIEPDSKMELTAVGQITYTLIKQATNAKTCTITGQNIIKYNSEGKAQNTSVVLTGNVSGVTITKWQYLDNTGTYQDYKHNGTVETGNTLTVNVTDSVFVNDIATIKLVTSDSSVIDIFGISIIRDGAPGEGTVVTNLTNDNQNVPYDRETGITDYTQATTTVTVYDGGEDVTSSWTIVAIPQSGTGIVMTGADADGKLYLTAVNNYTLHVTAMTTDSGNVIIECSKDGYAKMTKVFSITKVKSGADGKTPTIYSLATSTLAVNRDINSAYNPGSVTFYAYSQTGNDSKIAAEGTFKIFINGSTNASKTGTGTSISYTPEGSTLQTIKCVLYESGTSNELDSQTVVVISDGQTGQAGKGISKTEIFYKASSSGTTPPTFSSSDTNVPSVGEGSYLWTKIVYTYTDGTTSSAYSVSRMGKNGEAGTSVTIASTSVKYISKTNGQTIPTDPESSWSTSIPNVPDGSFLWTRTIVTYSDGTSTTSYSVGKMGATGESAGNVSIGNYADVIPCTSAGKTSSAFTITIPFSGYYGSNKVYTSASIASGKIYGTSSSSEISASITNATSNAEGKVVFNIPGNSLVGSSASVETGTVSITYTVTNGTTSAGSKTYATITQTYTWTKRNDAEDAVIHELYVNGKDIIDKNGTTSNDVVITSRLIKGASEVTSGVTRTWWKYNSSSTNADKYDEIIASANSATLTVTGDMVDGFASFKCIANGHVAYYCVRDYSDPLQVSIISTIGDQILNGVGIGAVYAVVHQNGIELDAVPEIVTSTSQATGTECYVVANKKVTYYKKTSGSWVTATPSLTCSYEWTFRDKDGNSTSFNGYSDSNPATGQIIYVDGDLIAKKIIIDLKVTK